MVKTHTRYFNALTFMVLCVFVLFSVSGFSQQNDLSVKATELVYSNPDEAIKINEHILRTILSDNDKASINAMIARCYLVKGDYDNAAIYIYKSGNQVAKNDFKTQIEIDLIKAKLLRILYLDNQSNQHLVLAESKLHKIISKTTRDSLTCYAYLERVSMHIDRRHVNEVAPLLNDISYKFKDFLETHPVVKSKLYIAKERALTNVGDFDAAFEYINKALHFIDRVEYNNLYDKAQVYNELGYLYLQKKEFKKSEQILFIALKYAEILDNASILEQINQNLAINYLGSNQKSKHKVFNDEFLVLNTQVELIEQESTNTIYNIISVHEDEFLKTEKIKYSNYTNSAIVGVLIIIFIGLFFALRGFFQIKRLKEIIRYLKISRNNYTPIKPLKKPSKKRIVIPEETEKNILAKLKRFETSTKFLNKDMSLAVLAGQFETNTKYLSEIINKHYNDNFNTFINKLRINFIIEKLKTDPNYVNYKISFLASESGFSSHSSFATVFKAIIGMSPVTFINLLKTELEDLKKSPKE